MYAMLTGNLPFTVEPFNIKSLYNKMMKNEMNAIPEHLSKSGEELLRKLLNPDPIKRISLKEAMEHPWLNEGYSNPLKPFPYPNKPTEDQVNPTILRYMNSNMEFNGTEVAENIKTNKPSSSLATYYLLLNKVKTMLLKMDPKKDKLKPRIDSNNISNSNSNNKQTTVKDLKQLKQTPQSANHSAPMPQQPTSAAATSGPVPTTPSQNNAATTAAAQSHNQRSVKPPGSTTITTTTTTTTAAAAASTNGSNQNTFTLIRNKTDIINNKYGIFFAFI
jgi:Neu-associated kinase